MVSKSNFNAELMMSGGVIMATKIANRCCKAANDSFTNWWTIIQTIDKFLRLSILFCYLKRYNKGKMLFFTEIKG